MRKLLTGLLPIFFASCLFSCGGGSSSGHSDSSSSSVSIASSIGASSSSSTSPALPPIASIVVPSSTITGMATVLDGTGSKDGNGDELTYSWSISAKPFLSKTIIKDPNKAIASIIPDTDGSYTIELKVNNQHGLENKTTINIVATGNPFNIQFKLLNQNDLVGDQIYIASTLQSPFEITSLIAKVGDVSVPLTYSYKCSPFDCGSAFRGLLDIHSIPFGDISLEIVAKDAFNTTSTNAIELIHDTPPALFILNPTDGDVAVKQLPVSAACNDDDKKTCKIRVVIMGNEVASADDNLNTSIDLSSYESTSLEVTYIATDSKNQSTTIKRNIYVENSANLEFILKTSGNIIDAKNNYVLYLTAGQEGDQLNLLNRDDNLSISVKSPKKELIRSAYISNFGAMFIVGNSPVDSQLYDWNIQTLYNLGTPNSSESLRVNGNFAIWNEGANLIRRNLSSLKNDELSNQAGNWKNDIATNGTAAWWDINHQIQFNNGTTKQITNDQTLWNAYVVVDGDSIVYRKSDPCCNQKNVITLFDGNAEIALGSARADSIEPPFDYQIHDNWVAYSQLGQLNQKNIWTYNLGQKTQRTYFGIDSNATIETLGDAGEVMIISNNKRYISTANGFLGEVGSGLGHSYQVNGDWYIYIGNQLFKVKKFYK